MDSNKTFALELFVQTLLSLFPNLVRAQVETISIAMFNNVDEWKNFKGTLRDLMVSTRSFASQENDFYAHEKKLEQEKAVKREQEKKMMVPGMKQQPHVSVEQL